MLIVVHLQEKLKEALSGPVEALLDEANSDTWTTIRKLLSRETETAVSGFSAALSGYDMDEETRQNMITSLEAYARGVVEAKARDEAGRVLIRMKDRYKPLATSMLLSCICWKVFLYKQLAFNLKTGLQHYLAVILIQCLVFGLERKTFEPSPRLPALLYDMIMNIIFCYLSFCCNLDIFMTNSIIFSP